MSWKDREEGGDGEDGGVPEEEEFEQVVGDERIMFLMDARRPMLELNDNGVCHLKDSLLVVLALMKSKITSNERSYLGLTFFGSEKKDADTSHPVFQYMALEQPSASRIRQLQYLVDNFDKAFHADIGCSDQDQGQDQGGGASSSTTYCPLREALWSCSSAFNVKNSVTKANDLKRVWLFTNDDLPNAHSESDQQYLLQVGRDCADVNIEISLWYLSRKGRPPFDVRKFYAKLLVSEDDEVLDDRVSDAGAAGFSDKRLGLENVLKRFVKKRAFVKGLMSLGVAAGGGEEDSELAFGVQFFKLVRPLKRPTYVTLHTGTNEPTKTVTFTIDAETGAALADSELGECVQIGNQSLAFTKADKESCLRVVAMSGAVSSSDAAATGGSSSSSSSSSGGDGTFDSAGGGFGISSRMNRPFVALRINFFTHASVLPPEFSLLPSMFVCPYEGQVVGSSAPFVALLKHMTSKGLMAVGTFAKNVTDTLRLCAILPQEEVLQSGGRIQLVPPGFNVVMMPFRSEVRFNATQINKGMHTASLQPNISEAADALVKQLALPVPPSHIPCYSTMENPANRKFYSILQALALSEQDMSWHPDQDQMTRHFQLNAAAAAASMAAASGQSSSSSSTAIATLPVAVAMQNLKTAGEAFVASIELPEDAIAQMNGKKRKAAGASGSAPKKAKKEVGAVDDAQIAEWKQAFGTVGDGAAMTNDALKDVCRALGCTVTGKKDVLVSRIVEKLNSM